VYCDTGRQVSLSVPQWDPDTEKYLSASEDRVVCCVLVFTVPKGAVVYSPASGEVTNTGGAVWRDTTTGSVVTTGGSALAIGYLTVADDGTVERSISLRFKPEQQPTEPCPESVWDVESVCYGQGEAGVGQALSTVGDETIPGFGDATIMLTHAAEGGVIAPPGLLTELYGVEE
jgi:hypothetical protein